MGASIQSGVNGPSKVHASLGFRREESQRELEQAYQVLGMPFANAAMKRKAQQIINEHARQTDPNPPGQRVDVKKSYPPEQVARVEIAKAAASEHLHGFDVLASVEYETVIARYHRGGAGEDAIVVRVGYTTKVESADEAAIGVRFKRPTTPGQWTALHQAIAAAATFYAAAITDDELADSADAAEVA